ncbi:MAG: type II toxin-antitoxin system prevent-host-death family antitoxin [Acidobacteria bacterium]|nr:type II toxin-antitoxin system prevent-host-death family antitoxin [Acidobacteriota bacterium]
MATVTALEAKTRLGELLDRVAGGGEIVITRHDRPVARIIPEGRPKLSQVQEAVQQLEALRESMRQRGFEPLTDEEVQELIEEGRRQ